ncbi:MAG TPA: hypothetical protein DCL77_06685 [Prolixibacteraceae bacterium]|jgi:hypothetical protein|nr:hypothetical protein [Prolixibacteraceae bacterium]
MGLKSRIANRILDSKLSLVAREKKFFNLDSAQTAGILWQIDQKESFDRVNDELVKAGIKVTGLCYFPLRKATIQEGIIGFSRKQTNYWTEVPNVDLVDDFIHQKFDLLIDLTGQKYFPMVYINALSEATFKIGYAGSSSNYFDLNIDFQESPETSQLADQILYYLKRINKTTIE